MAEPPPVRVAGEYVLATQAEEDIFTIWSYIAADNPNAAAKVEEAILAACDLVTGSPNIGRVRRDLTKLPLRFWTVTQFPSYMIVYSFDASVVTIVGVFHGRRNVRRILRQRLN